ncbi:hypothetical protein [Bradyrhizobium sp. ERR14]|uniref:hypothetical protein n=1 Tax=Bradyrhizobium sp. ERR14 TaxID=2663837 RepID=UPI00160927D7|nr:hypothetical protein [Bradyrhizobium sp. ERR14]MBB4399242.1 hypothetical protein [Bradyrhizobium sp. ERR14]
MDILTGCVSRSYQVLQRFMKRVRHPDMAELAGPMQTSQSNGAAPVILDPLARLSWRQRRGAHATDYPHFRELTLNVVATSCLADELDDTMSTRQTSSKLADCCWIVIDRADVSNLTSSFRVRHCDRKCLLMHVETNEGTSPLHSIFSFLAGPPQATRRMPTRARKGHVTGFRRRMAQY